MSSSDEGEIVEGVEDSKATSLPHTDEAGVDRMDRTRAKPSRSSPDSVNGSRHNAGRRSRSPRGHKRPREDFHRGTRPDSDPRRFRVHYEDSRDGYGRSRLSYDDQDRVPGRASNASLYYDDRDRNHSRSRANDRSRERDRDRDRERTRTHYPEKRPRNRSPSPYRSSRDGRDRDGPFKRDSDRNWRTADRDSTNGFKLAQRDRRPSGDIQITGDHKDAQISKGQADKVTSSNTPEQAHEPEQDYSLEPVDIDAEIERRRRRREELLAKSRSRAATPMLVQALHTRGNTPVATEANTPKSEEGMSPGAIDISNDHELINTHGESRNTDDDGPSAADYDPTDDMREDELRDERRHGHIGPHGEAPPSEQKAEIPPTKEEQKPRGDEDDDFDMFAEDFDEEKFAVPQATRLDTSADDRKIPTTQLNGGGMLEGDDKDGYYKIRSGELMDGRYQVQSTVGKGMFSGVARAIDITNKKPVAIKMMRNNDALRKGGFTEIAILQKLNDADPENRKHIVKFERHFEHKGHLCLAFENLSLNLREVLKKFGNNVGINLSATRAYAHQTFVALAHLRKCTIIHADLKPDNILVNETRNILKICDLGTAIDRSDAVTAHNEITPYLVSRFYRAPEIILGMPYDYAVDMWSIGCTLYELYTGKILFTGSSNNQMLKAIIEIRGKFSTKLYKRGELSHMHFDDMGNFVSIEHDKALGKVTTRTMAIVKPTRDLRTRLMAASGGMSDAENRELNHFVDLLERCLALNPDKRITPSEALKHPFFLAKAR
ncbi:kinase-like domain-containing protein [Xylariaceae sp. FL0016]|nr:kinase-like domain-containing protein [Xylariaceae sp. FL0016]